jgi:integrase
VRRYIRPALGNKKLVKLDARHVQALLRSKLDEGLSPTTVRYTYAVLRRALKQAKRWRLVEHNVAEDVDPPRQIKQETKVLSSEQVRALLVAARGDRLESLYVLGVTVGLRQGELLGLRWDDVDLKTGKLKIDRQLQRRRDGSGLALVPTKTGRGRTVRLGSAATKALKAHRQRQAEEKLKAGSLYPDHHLIFVTTIGTPLDAQNVVNRSFKPLLERAGLPPIRFHDLRHTCASLLLSKGINPKIVQECLGHSSITVTMDVYSHLMPDIQAGAADAMDDLLAEEDDLPAGA